MNPKKGLKGYQLFSEGKIQQTVLEQIWNEASLDDEKALLIDRKGRIREEIDPDNFSGAEIKKENPFSRQGIVVLSGEGSSVMEAEERFFGEFQPAWVLLVSSSEQGFVFYGIQQIETKGLLERGSWGPETIQELDGRDLFEEMERSWKVLYEAWAGKTRERVLTVGISSGERESDLQEMALLVETAGGTVIEEIEQKREKPDPAYYIGKGKVSELAREVNRQGISLVIFDVELSPAQQHNLQETVQTRVIDRSQLILDIFARHAHTREGQIQVELAQLNYLLPRLVGRGQELSRLAGGIGTRGPGETKLEVDRRRIRDRITELKKELEQIKKQRNLLQKGRRLPFVAMVGYTNAGKSTLLNKITGSTVKTADQLFATLDPTIRGCRLPDGREILLTDTVGFIKNIPHHLIAAFRATLEGVEQADALLMVVDVCDSRYNEQMETVLEVLDELEALGKPILTVFNKMDLYPDPEELTNLGRRYQPAVAVSARTGENIDGLLACLGDVLGEGMETREFLVPYSQGGIIDRLHRQAQVLREEYEDEGIRMRVKIGEELYQEIKGQLDFS